MNNHYVFSEKDVTLLFKKVQLLCIDLEMAILTKKFEINDGKSVIKFGEEFLSNSSDFDKTVQDAKNKSN